MQNFCNRLDLFFQLLGLASDDTVDNMSSVGLGKVFTDQFKSCMEFKFRDY